MHDPSFLMFTIPAPWLRFSKALYHHGDPRWGIRIARFTNAEHLGKRIYPWYRPKAYRVSVAGRSVRLETLFDVWHDEPGGGDMRTVCKVIHPRGLGWMVKHRKHLRWELIPWFRVKCRFQRCDECHRRMWKATRFGTGWDAPGVLHYECSSLRHLRGQRIDLLKKIAGVADWTENWRADRQVDAWLGMSDMSDTEAAP